MSNYIGERTRVKAQKHSQECLLKSFTMLPVKSGELIVVVAVLGRIKSYVKREKRKGRWATPSPRPKRNAQLALKPLPHGAQ